MSKKPFLILTILVSSLFLTNCAVGAWFIPSVSIWIAEAEGKAKLAEAESSRRVQVLEAQAKLDSAKMLGDAEVARAVGGPEGRGAGLELFATVLDGRDARAHEGAEDRCHEDDPNDAGDAAAQRAGVAPPEGAQQVLVFVLRAEVAARRDQEAAAADDERRAQDAREDVEAGEGEVAEGSPPATRRPPFAHPRVVPPSLHPARSPSTSAKPASIFMGG